MDAMFMSGLQREERRQIIVERYGISASDGQEGDEKMLFRFCDGFYDEQGVGQGMEKGIFSPLFQLVNNHVITEAEGAKQAKISVAEFCARLKSYNEAAEEQEVLPQTV